MTPIEILKLVNAPENTRLDYGELLFEFLTANGLSNGLELRTRPGVSTVYIAGALHSLGKGTLRSVVEKLSKATDYDTREALRRTRLSEFVSVDESSEPHNWRLMKMLQNDQLEQLDFCVIDGGTLWTGVGFSCCLLEKLLKPGGWIVVDNLNFSFRESRLKNKGWVKSKSEEEQTAFQVQSVYELLLQRNAAFDTVRRRKNIAWARKRLDSTAMWKSSHYLDERTIGAAVERARHDPEFREELLEFGVAALSIPNRDRICDASKITFVESDCRAPQAPQCGQNGELKIFLDRPSWERNTDEATLEALLKG